MSTPLLRLRRAVVSLTVAGLAVMGLSAPATADTRPADPANPVTVSADALPAPQINGVVWSQVVVGDTVYAAGSFTKARPFGSALGVNEVDRTHLLAYSISTGELVPGFAPVLDGQARSITRSPDGKRIYVVGDFSHVDGQWRVRIAAWDTATNTLVAGFRPTLASGGLAVAATNTTVYAGGNFKSAASVTGGALQPRMYVAAFDAANGAVTPFRADANAAVTALAVTADGGKVVVGGRFTSLSGAAFYGLGAVDPTSGAPSTFPANAQIRDAGTSSAITSLYADATGVYGTGYHYGAGGNLEGTFRTDPSVGELTWVTDCHGDAYSAFPVGEVVYVASHHHYCGNMGGFPQTEPWTFYHATAFTKKVTGQNTSDIYGYPDHRGEPAPSMLTWFPQFLVGTFTGQGQGPWSVAGNSEYIVYGGEFIGVNNKPQQGLVRFAVEGKAPNDQGPRLSGNDWDPNVTSPSKGTVRLNFRTNWDRDNETLTYRVYRGTETSTPIFQESITTKFWKPQTRAVKDAGLPPGSSQKYRVTATDVFGNIARSNWITLTVNSTDEMGRYAEKVLDDGATSFWRLGDASGPTVTDWAGRSPAQAAAGVTFGRAGAVGDGTTAAGFSGTSTGLASTRTAVEGPQSFTLEAWVRTSSTLGGKIVGFGNAATGLSSSYDRHLYMTTAGRVLFGVYPGAERTLSSPTALNDGRWHHVAGTLGSDGMTLFVDGKQVAQRTDTTSAQTYNGYWRIGGDRSWSGAQYFNGEIDEVALYGGPLTAAQVDSHWQLANGVVPNQAPTAAFTQTVTGLGVQVDASGSTDTDGTIASYTWSFGDGTPDASGVTASHTYTSAGTYTVTLTVRDDDGATATTTRPVTVAVPNQAPTAAFTATVDGSSVAVDATRSADPDGTIASYVWSFGDGTPSATGATTTHAYTAAGTYPVQLTVTDDDGATATSTRSVTVSAPAGPQVFAVDTFGRTSSSGWGTGETGGPWTLAGSASLFTVGDGVGRLSLAKGGSSPRANLAGVRAGDVDVRATVTLDKLPNAGTTRLWLAGRTNGFTSEYTAKANMASTGVVSSVQIVKRVANVETVVATASAPGLTVVAGQPLSMRLQISGSGTTTLRAKVWRSTATEPTTWQVSTTDATPELQAAGGVGVGAYLATTATNIPVTVSWDDVRATTIDG